MAKRNKSTSASEVLLMALTDSGEYNMGYMRNFEANEVINVEGLMVIGEYLVKEQVYHSLTVNWNADKATIFERTLKEIGLVPKPENFIFFGGFLWRLVDRKTGGTLCLLDECHANNVSWTVAGQTIIASRLSGVAKQLFDRSEVAA